MADASREFAIKLGLTAAQAKRRFEKEGMSAQDATALSRAMEHYLQGRDNEAVAALMQMSDQLSPQLCRTILDLATHDVERGGTRFASTAQ